MRRSALLLGQLLALIASAQAAQKTVSFDDFPTAGGYANIPSGYEGLQFYYFAAMDGTSRPPTEGYRRGITSPNNVAFNLSGEPAWIGCGDPFDVHSVQLTPAVISAMSVRIQGYAGGIAVYDTTHALTIAGPTLVTLNYSEVDRVVFTGSPGSPFAMDDLKVTVPVVAPESAHTVQASAIGHHYSNPNFHPPPFPQFPIVVTDLIVDQGQSTPGTGVLPKWRANFDQADPISMTVSAPPGQKFVVRPPAGRAVRFSGSLKWGYNQNGGPTVPGPVAVSFTGLEGVAPSFAASGAVLAPYHGYFGFENIQSTEVTGELKFESITFTTSLSSSYTGSGTLNYSPITASTFGLLYQTTEQTDPGSFVSLEAGATPPALSVTSAGPGQIQIRWTSADTGFYLQEATSLPSVNWQFVPGVITVGQEHSVNLSVSGDHRFFRLLKD